MIVISLGGSLLYTDKKFDEAFAKQAAECVKRIAEKQKTAVVVGGGFLAARNAERARKKTKSEYYADVAAIKATRANAKKMLALLAGDACPSVLKKPEDFPKAFKAKNIAVSGGFLPGLTTDSCSVLVAEATYASKVVNASKIDAVYSADPAKDPDARPLPSMTFQELVDLAAKSDTREARTNFVFDLVAAKLAARAKMPVEFVDGKNLDLLVKVANGEQHGGTYVT